MTHRGQSDGERWPISTATEREESQLDATGEQLLASLPGLYFVVSRQGEFQASNDRFNEVLGYTDGEIADLDPMAIVAPTDRKAMHDAVQRVVTGEETTLQLRLQRKDGTLCRRRLTVTPKTDDAGTVRGIVGIAQGPPEQDTTDDQQRQSLLMSQIPGIVYRCRAEPGWPMTYVRGECLAITGYEARALESGRLSWTDDLLYTEECDHLWEQVQPALDQNRPFQLTHRIERNDGTVRWLCTHGRCVDRAETTVLEGFVTDITERKRRQTRASEALGPGVYVFDRDYQIIETNDAFAGIVGYKRGDLVGMSVTEFLPDYSVEQGERLWEQLPTGEESGNAVVTLEGEFRHRDGTRIPIDAQFSLLPSETEFMGVVYETSDRRARAAVFEQLQQGMRELRDVQTVREVATKAASIIQHQFDFATTETRLLRDDQLELVAVGTSDEHGNDDRPPTYEVGEGLVGEAYTHGEPVIYDDLDAGESVAGESQARSALLLPIDGYGMISIVATEPSAFDETDLELGRLFVADVAAAFSRAEQTEQLRQRKRKLAQYETLVETMGDAVYMTNADHEITMVNDAMVSLTGYDREQLQGMVISELGGPELTRRGRKERERLIAGEIAIGQVAGPLQTATGETVPAEDRFALLPHDDQFRGTVGVIRDVTQQREREQRLKAQRDELETLNRINELVHETIGSLAAAATREEIETTVCDRLADSSLYRFAAIGTHPPGAEHIEFETWAGDGAGYLSEVDIPADPSVKDAGPAAHALETGRVVVTRDIESDPSVPAAALEHGFQSVAAIPFTYDGAVHGILCVYADRADAFSDRERKAYEVLGEMVGFAISATQNRRLIESDRSLKLTFDLTGVDSMLTEIATHTGSACRLMGSAESSGEETLDYVAVEAAEPEAVLAVIEDDTDCRLVRSDEDRVVLERRAVDSIPSVLLTAGFRPLEIVTESDSVRIVAEAPLDADIRSVTDRLAAYGDVSLVSKREGEGWREPTDSVRDTLSTELTDRQQAVLKASYFGGYFDWPRESTAEEIAESLDISSPTLHQHLRHAQRKLLSAYLAADQSRT